MEKKHGYVYSIRNKLNGKIYVGKKTEDRNHKYFCSSSVIHEEIQSGLFGLSDYEKKILVEGYFDRVELSILEKKYILELNSYKKNNPLGYNLTLGGGHCGSRLEKPPWNKGLTKKDHPSIIKYANSCSMKKIENYKKENHPMFGKKHTDETKEKIREATKKRNLVGSKNPRARRISIDGIEYDCLREASQNLNIPQPTITYRLKSNNFENYQYL